MKNKIIVFGVIFLMILETTICPAIASYYYDDGANSDNPNVDKFKSTSGLKIKESNIANWMENATRNAMEGNKNQTVKYNQNKSQNTKSTGQYKKSYKWF